MWSCTAYLYYHLPISAENSITFPDELSGKSVLIFARDNGETISIFVQDNGNGIDEALIDNPVSDELPYGTSLYICRKLCENSGLEFTVHSESGNGTAIEIKCRKAL